MPPSALSRTCSRVPVLWVRPGHVGYLGPELDVGPHSTPVACLGLGLDGPFRLETADHGEHRARSMFAMARARHRIVTDGWILLLYAEPGGAASKALLDGMTRTEGPYGFHSRHEAALLDAARTGVDALDHLVSSLAPPPRPPDPRVMRVVRAIRSDPSAFPRARGAADAVGMSVSHFLRAFAAATGTTFRRYRQWARLRAVGVGLNGGHDLTRCAADAGFASPSHLSETFRRTFGLSLTGLLASGVEVDVR
ncbi:AraC family transcriptional regulator [Nocardiopsis sp. NPDC049922]|uniref:helix-turn-helix transcriptional regulator n=1 Tax=Nocardiopsis sp. NPDC049922 TaxID=3155157 RepID=UPI00340213A8